MFGGETTKMKKQILALCASAAMLTSVCSFGSCSKAAENTRMTVDINPSVELMVDKDNKVISVTANYFGIYDFCHFTIEPVCFFNIGKRRNICFFFCA